MNMANAANSKVLRFPPPLWVVVVSGLAACVMWAYWPVLGAMYRKWSTDAQYSHGNLVPVFALVLLWLRRGHYLQREARGRWMGLALLAAALGLYLYGSYVYLQWFEAISLVPCLAGLCLLLGGWPLLQWAWPSIAFLAFMVPLPYRVEMAFCDRLQALATVSATFCLQTFGFPAFYEGTDILLNDSRIGVVKACSGLGMLMTFFALSVAVALLIRGPLWERLLVVVSAVPIALASNVTRITATVLLQQATDDKSIQQAAHDWAGYLMMIFGLLLLGLELKYLSYLFPRTVRTSSEQLQKPPMPRAVPSVSPRKAREPRPRPAVGKT